MHDDTLPPNPHAESEPTSPLSGLLQMEEIQPNDLVGLHVLERQTVASRLFNKCSPMAAIALLSDKHGAVQACATLSMTQMLLDRTRPPARTLAYQLAIRDITVQGVSEPNNEEDGMIIINDRVHVQVPYSPDAPGVVKANPDGTLTFRPPTHNLQQIIADIHEDNGLAAG